MANKTFEGYLKTNCAQKLLKDYTLAEHGIWRILGEDQNCDAGGSHYMPELDLVECSLEVAIRYAVELPGFWTWGAGGRLQRLAEPKKLTMEIIQHRKELQKRLKQLDEERNVILRQL